MRAVVLVLLSTAAWVTGQLPSLGGCPDQSVQQNFTPSAYLGKWYEQEKYFTLFQAGGKCTTAVYTDQGNGTIGVNNTEYSMMTDSLNSIQGTANVTDTSGEAKLAVMFPSIGNYPAPYWVLDTDYNSYSIVWYCIDFLSIANAQFLWVLTRDKNPSNSTMANITSIIEQRQLDTSSLQMTIQDCDN